MLISVNIFSSQYKFLPEMKIEKKMLKKEKKMKSMNN
jgi:hypothetical protein